MRYLFGFMCVLTLGAMGCGETAGTGGSAGSGGTLAPDWNVVELLCDRLEECIELVPLIGGVDYLDYCVDSTKICLDENLPTQLLKEDWILLVDDCLTLSTCALFVDCWLNDVPFC